jgi:predicted permease
MSLIDAWRHRLRTWLGRSRFEREMSEEMQFHREMEERSQLESGADAEEAGFAARRAMGSEAWHKDEVRRTAGLERVDSIRQDVRYALRQLGRKPGFTAVVVLALGLGIGVNLVIFGLVNSLILNPLPGIEHPERLAMVSNRMISYPEFRDYQDRTPGELAGVGAFRRRIVLSVKVDGPAALVNTGVVSGNFFPLTGARTSLGRTLLPTDDQAGAGPVVVVSHGFWRRSLGSDPSVLGRTILLNGQSFTIVGVTEPRFHGLQLVSPSDLWIPMSTWPLIAPSGFQGLNLQTRTWGWLVVFGVMKPGVELARAEAALNQIAGQIKEAHPDAMPNADQLSLVGGSAAALPDGRDSMIEFFSILSTVVLLVMLLAVSNVGNLILARTAHRHQEISVRLALGAGRWRLVRQFMTEAMVLALLAGTVAVILMVLVIRLLRGFTFPGGMTIDRLGIGLDPALFGLAILAVLLTGLVLGILPAAKVIRGNRMTSLRGNPGDTGRPRSRLQGGLLATQVALGLILLVGAALFTRGLQRALGIDPGIRTEGVLTATVDVGLPRLTPAQAAQYFTAASERIRALPGVEDAGWSGSIPLTSDESVEQISIDGYKDQDGNDPVIEVITVSSRYLSTVQIPMIRGAGFDSTSVLGQRTAVVVNETAAAQYWPGTDPLGRRLVVGGDSVVVAGISRDFAYHNLSGDPVPVIFRPLAGNAVSTGVATLTLFVRFQGRAADMGRLVQRELLALNPEVPVFDVSSFDTRLADLLTPQRLGFRLLGGFGLLALIIASVGVYGVVGYVVARRTREVGIRMALGESQGSVVRRMIRENLLPVVVGAVVGIAVSVAGARALVGFLYGVSPADPLAYLVSILILLAASLTAAAIPARRASQVSPMTALRSE